MEFLLELGKFLIATTILGGLIVWIMKEFLKMKFSREVESHKQEIDNHFYQQKLRFSKLHEERLLLIKQIYALVVSEEKGLNNDISNAENIEKHELEKIKDDISKHLEISVELESTYQRNKILLPVDICSLFDDFLSKTLDMRKNILVAHLIISGPENLDEKKVDEYISLLDKLKKAQTDIPIIKTSLEKEFRRTLGIFDLDK